VRAAGPQRAGLYALACACTGVWVPRCCLVPGCWSLWARSHPARSPPIPAAAAAAPSALPLVQARRPGARASLPCPPTHPPTPQALPLNPPHPPLLPHRVAWLAADQLASTSDDRTARLWALPRGAALAAGGPMAGAAPLLAPRLSLWGHGARVWDCAVAAAGGGGLVATAGEDCSCRLWDGSSGRQLAVLQGHGGRGVWRCLLADGHVVTAGADGSALALAAASPAEGPPCLRQRWPACLCVCGGGGPQCVAAPGPCAV
jgi:hypothetical protein